MPPTYLGRGRRYGLGQLCGICEHLSPTHNLSQTLIAGLPAKLNSTQGRSAAYENQALVTVEIRNSLVPEWFLPFTLKWTSQLDISWNNTPGVANRTKPNQKAIEPNRTQSFDWSSIESAIEHNRTGTFLWVRLISITEPNRTQSATRLVRFCSEKQNGMQHW